MSQWFEMSTGSLVVGEAAYEERLEQAPPGDLVPLADLLLGNVSLEGAAKAPEGTYEKPTSNESLEQYGKWLIKVARERDPKAYLKTAIMQRANDLGIGMGPSNITKRYKSFNSFREKVDTPRYSAHRTYQGWTIEDFIKNARKLSTHLHGRKPTGSDYFKWARSGNGPSPNIIFEQLGGVRLLNSYLGFPDISAFEYEDYVDWGVRVMRTNNGQRINLVSITVLSKRSTGPSEGMIYKNFGSIPNFADTVAKQYEISATQQEEAATEQTRIYDSLNPELIADTVEWSDEQKQAFIARYRVAKHCLLGVPQCEIVDVAKRNTREFINALIKNDPNLTAGHVEVLAESLGVFDIIWNLYPNDERTLALTEKELDAQRNMNRKRKRRQANAARKKTQSQVA